MAAELPVCDVLCEAMEYLSKLGSNLRTRSESLKQKRISKDKLRNAHAVHKAANKVLLICELSKKSLDNVETGVRKVLSIIDASQAHDDNIGGKTINKTKQQNQDKYHYFEFETHKLRISQKISLKHYLSAKVFAKSMPSSILEKYPVFYDCKLRRHRTKSFNNKTEVTVARSLQKKNSNCEMNTYENPKRLLDEKQKGSITPESIGSASEKSEDRKKSVDYDETNNRTSSIMSDLDVEDATRGKNIPTQSNESLDTQGDVSNCEVVDKQHSNINLVTSKKNNEGEKHQTNENLTVSDLVECFANAAKVDDNVSQIESKNFDLHGKKTSDGQQPGKRERQGNSIRKKFSKIRITDDSTESDEELKSNIIIQQENISSCKGSSFKNHNSDSEPNLKKMKLNDGNEDVLSKEDSDNNSRDSQSKNEDIKDDASKPIIRCVNITKLLKPDVLGPEISKKSNIDKKKKLTTKQNKGILKGNKEQKYNNQDGQNNINSIENENDSEFWARKRSEVKNFKAKKFTVIVKRLPQLSKNFLLMQNLKRISQGCKTICEITNEKNERLDYSVKNIDEVKNALLNDSASEDTDSAVTAEANKIKSSLLNDSDSDREQTLDSSQISQEKLIDTAAIKDALLNESESENNEEQVMEKRKNKNLDSGISESTKDVDPEDTAKIKSTLLNDSDSDKVQTKDDNDRIPTLEKTTNDEGDESISRDNLLESNKQGKLCDVESNVIEQNKPVQDSEIIKSSLLNDSSDSKSDISVINKRREKLQHRKKRASKSMKAKKMLLHYSSSSDNENDHSQESDNKSKKLTHKERRRKSCTSNSSNEAKDAKHKRKNKGSAEKDKDKIDEHSNSSNSEMVRSKAKPSGSSGQNSDNQDASDKDIDGLTNLNNLNKPSRRRDSSSTNNTESRSSVKISRSKAAPVIGEDLLQAVSSSDASEEENMVEEDLPPVNLSGLNGVSIGHLAKDDLLGDSDSSGSNKEQDEAEEPQNAADSEEEESVKLKRRKANAISSDSEGGMSRRKQNDEDVRLSDDFEESEDESSETAKRSKRKKKGSESDASGTSSTDAGKKKRRRIKQLNDSDGSGSDTENEGRNKHGRKNIRKVMGKNQLEEATKKAAREEKERIARITERQKLYNNLDFDESGKPDEVVLEKVVLDFDPETKEPLIEVDRGLVKKLKPHQANGIKFMWDACFESVKRIKKDKGSGCILAHCMGLGKTLQVISLTHTLLIHGSLTGVNRVLVVCPLSTVLNWVNEFKMWLKHAHSEFEVDVYELSRYKQNSERAFQLQQWFDGGGVCVLGYEMFRNLSADNNKKFKKKMLRSFQESLVDPGPDLVVCDEGHLLKNEKTSLSQSMNRVKTRRRIVLTGTPLQNNLKEYYCMVQFVKPNLLGKYNEYLNRFVNPITNGQYTDSTEHDIKVMKRRSHVLHKMLDGAVQRRDYGVLAPFLPPKHEYVLFITLSDVQVKLYQFYLDNYSRRPLPGKSSGFLFPDFQSLQRIWTHPLVLKYNSERYEIMQQKKREREEEDSEGSLVDFIDDDSTPEETSTEESSDDLSDVSDDSRKKSKKKKAAKKSKAKDSKVGTRRGTRANPELDDDDDVAEVVEVKNENPTEWWIKLVEDEELEDMRNSHKLVLLFDILRQCDTIGDKLLVFSQSLYSLDLIEHFLGKVDEATQEGRVDEKLGGHIGSWSPGVDYFRLDGSTSCENRSIWCKNFNREDNPRARLFLISTRAGGLGINLVAANRVVIFDVSWNPSHDVQSIFRVYRFGQKKPCYVYRFLAMGTMEEKIYERQVTKQAISKRVIDEQQIDRHYAENDLAELYKFEARPDEPRPLPTLPKDRLFAEMLKEHEAQIYKYHEHDSLLENKEEETLSEEERKAAWEDFENEKNKPPPAPFPSAWPMHNGMVPGLLAQQQQLAYAALAAMLRKDMPNINDNQIRDMLPLIYNSNPGLMQKMSEIYKYAQPGMMNPGMMNPVMNAAGAGGGGAALGGASGLQYEPPWQRQHQQQQQMRLQQLMQQNQNMGAKFYAGGLGSRDPVAMALQQQRAREIMMGGGGAAAAGRPRGRPPLAPRAPPASADVVNLDSD